MENPQRIREVPGQWWTVENQKWLVDQVRLEEISPTTAQMVIRDTQVARDSTTHEPTTGSLINYLAIEYKKLSSLTTEEETVKHYTLENLWATQPRSVPAAKFPEQSKRDRPAQRSAQIIMGSIYAMAYFCIQRDLSAAYVIGLFFNDSQPEIINDDYLKTLTGSFTPFVNQIMEGECPNVIHKVITDISALGRLIYVRNDKNYWQEMIRYIVALVLDYLYNSHREDIVRLRPRTPFENMDYKRKFFVDHHGPSYYYNARRTWEDQWNSYRAAKTNADLARKRLRFPGGLNDQEIDPTFIPDEWLEKTLKSCNWEPWERIYVNRHGPDALSRLRRGQIASRRGSCDRTTLPASVPGPAPALVPSPVSPAPPQVKRPWQFWKR